jgi:hypothetical protein
MTHDPKRNLKKVETWSLIPLLMQCRATPFKDLDFGLVAATWRAMHDVGHPLLQLPLPPPMTTTTSS